MLISWYFSTDKVGRSRGNMPVTFLPFDFWHSSMIPLMFLMYTAGRWWGKEVGKKSFQPQIRKCFYVTMCRFSIGRNEHKGNLFWFIHHLDCWANKAGYTSQMLAAWKYFWQRWRISTESRLMWSKQYTVACLVKSCPVATIQTQSNRRWPITHTLAHICSHDPVQTFAPAATPY